MADEPTNAPAAAEPEAPAPTPSLLAVLRAEEPRPEPRRDSAASLLASLRDEPSPSETITEVVPVVPAPVHTAPEQTVPEPAVHEPAAPEPAPAGLTSLAALAPLAATPPAADPASPESEPELHQPAAPAMPQMDDLDALVAEIAPAPAAGLPHLAAAPIAVPQRVRAEDSRPQIPADANLPRLGSPGSTSVPVATTAADAEDPASAPDLATWTPAAQNMAAVQIWEMVDELTVPEPQPQLVPSGADDDRKSRGWRKGRKG